MTTIGRTVSLGNNNILSSVRERIPEAYPALAQCLGGIEKFNQIPHFYFDRSLFVTGRDRSSMESLFRSSVRSVQPEEMPYSIMIGCDAKGELFISLKLNLFNITNPEDFSNNECSQLGLLGPCYLAKYSGEEEYEKFCETFVLTFSLDKLSLYGEMSEGNYSSLGRSDISLEMMGGTNTVDIHNSIFRHTVKRQSVQIEWGNDCRLQVSLVPCDRVDAIYPKNAEES